MVPGVVKRFDKIFEVLKGFRNVRDVGAEVSNKLSFERVGH